MSGLGERVRSAVPALVLFPLVAGAMLLLAIVVGFAPKPPLFQLILTLVAAVGLAFLAAYQVKAALARWQGAPVEGPAPSSQRRAPGGPPAGPKPPTWDGARSRDGAADRDGAPPLDRAPTWDRAPDWDGAPDWGAAPTPESRREARRSRRAKKKADEREEWVETGFQEIGLDDDEPRRGRTSGRGKSGGSFFYKGPGGADTPDDAADPAPADPPKGGRQRRSWADLAPDSPAAGLGGDAVSDGADDGDPGRPGFRTRKHPAPSTDQLWGDAAREEAIGADGWLNLEEPVRQREPRTRSLPSLRRRGRRGGVTEPVPEPPSGPASGPPPGAPGRFAADPSASFRSAPAVQPGSTPSGPLPPGPVSSGPVSSGPMPAAGDDESPTARRLRDERAARAERQAERDREAARRREREADAEREERERVAEYEREMARILESRTESRLAGDSAADRTASRPAGDSWAGSGLDDSTDTWTGSRSGARRTSSFDLDDPLGDDPTGGGADRDLLDRDARARDLLDRDVPDRDVPDRDGPDEVPAWDLRVGPKPKSARTPRPAEEGLPRPSWKRITLVTLAVVVLALAIWVRLTVVGAFVADAAQVLVGYFSYVVPLLPLVLLAPLRRSGQRPFPWRRLRRAGFNTPDITWLTLTTLETVRDRVFTRTTGIVLATLGLLHLMRGAPSIGDGGYVRGGGIAGYLVGEPLRLAFATSGAIGLLTAVLACAGLVTAIYVARAWGMNFGYAALAIGLVIPLVATGASHWFGFNHYLGVDNGRVVVISGLSGTHRHALHDTGIAASALPVQLRGLLDKGLAVDDRDDGERVAKAFAQPSTAAVEAFKDGDFQLRLGECFDWIGGSSQLRYQAPCNAAHVGEVYFVGRLPFKVDPGRNAVEVAARAMCELPYAEYLGVPYGQSYLPLETPLTGTTGWTAQPVIACWLAAVGPWSLKGTKTVGALQQTVPWSATNGCKIESDAGIRLTIETALLRCVAPGPGQTLSVPEGGFTIDAEFSSIGRNVGDPRFGVACLDGNDIGNGYAFLVAPDGTIEVHRYAGAADTVIARSGKPRNAGTPVTSSTSIQATCKYQPGAGVRLSATAPGGRTVAHVDATPVTTSLSPRLVFAASPVVPVATTIVVFSAVRA